MILVGLAGLSIKKGKAATRLATVCVYAANAMKRLVDPYLKSTQVI